MGQPDQMMPADTARALADVYDWVQLIYDSGAFPLGVGVKDGYAKLVALINSFSGTFALAIYSEGSIIGKMAEDALLTGELQHRQQDWIATVAWGDACRELHHWYGAPTDPGGFGISGPKENRVNTDPRVRSYVYPWNFGDVYTNTPNNATGQRMTLAYQFVIERWSGAMESIEEEFIQFVGGPVPNAMSILMAVLKYFMFMAQGQVPHMNYPIDDAVAYLRQRAIEVPARQLITA